MPVSSVAIVVMVFVMLGVAVSLVGVSRAGAKDQTGRRVSTEQLVYRRGPKADGRVLSSLGAGDARRWSQ